MSSYSTPSASDEPGKCMSQVKNKVYVYVIRKYYLYSAINEMIYL